jgi:DNA-binding transcriptional LysR family regulator
MTKPLDLVHFRSLAAIVDCGGFSKAAAVLHISQPALSQHIRLLERDLGLKLFDRHGRGVRLTPDGERALVEARRLLAAHDQAVSRLRQRPQRSLVVGTSEHLAELVLRYTLKANQESARGPRLSFRVGRSAALLDAVEKGQLDLAFILNPGERTLGALVTEVPLRWFTAPGWQCPADGEPWPLIAFEEPCALRSRAVAVLAEQCSEISISVQSTTLDGALAATRMGLGTTLLPRLGEVPDGIEERTDLPGAGHAALELVARQGLEPELADFIGAAGEMLAASPLGAQSGVLAK